MGFVATKVLLALLLPPASILLLVLSGLIVRRWHPAAGRALSALGFVILYLLSIPLVADLLIRPLESAAPPLAHVPLRADAVVVLGNGVRDLSWVPLAAEPTGTGVERMAAGVAIARAARTPLVLSGGSGEISDTGTREADAMASLAVRLGIERQDLIVENRSRNTLENAREVRALVAGRTIVLVTSAYHMRRAILMFERQGFEVIPAPAAYRSQTRTASAANLLPRAEHLMTSSLAIAERLSTAWYRLTGAI